MVKQAMQHNSPETETPEWVNELTGEPQQYLNRLLKMVAFSKMQEYDRKQEPFRARYNAEFPAFEKRVVEEDSEDTDAWDDYVVWKGVHAARQKWAERYRSL